MAGIKKALRRVLDKDYLNQLVILGAKQGVAQNGPFIQRQLDIFCGFNEQWQTGTHHFVLRNSR